MRVGRLWLTHFRNYNHAEAELAPGLTLVVGPNGEGKTNLLEAVAFLATLSSFRGAPTEALVEVGCERAVVRAEGERGGRRLLVEAELAVSGRPRVAVNRQAVRRTRDLLDSLRVSVFAPDDLVLVKGGPAERRRWLDEALAALRPQADATRADFERILRQRNALLRQAGGRLDASASATLDVWDAKLTATGEALATARAQLLAQLEPRLDDCYHQLSGTGTITNAYDAPWREVGLAEALAKTRAEEVRRGLSLVGPQRDDVVFTVGALPARTHASQGEQRSLALALRLAVHETVAESAGETPVLLLDDVFSELDPGRAEALLAHLPPGQTILTTAGSAPPAARPELVLRIRGGTLEEAA